MLGVVSAGVAPRVMGYGPAPAVQALCDRSGVAVSKIDGIEFGEAFAAQPLAATA